MEPLVIHMSQLMRGANEFLWVYLRVAGLFVIAPVFNSRLIPARVRLMLSLLVAMAVFAGLQPRGGIELFSFTGVLVGLQQLLIGLVIGFVLQLVFGAVALAGEMTATTMGLGFAQMADPQNGVPIPVLSQFYVLLATLIFLAMNGHIGLIGLVADSFHGLPVAPLQFDGEMFGRVLAWGSQLFAGAVLVAVPVVTGLLVASLAAGVMSRSAPQFNVFDIGFPLILLSGFVLIWLTLPVFADIFARLVDESTAFLMQLLRV